MEDKGHEVKQKLVSHIKKEVKQLMEEAVAKKYISEDSSTVNSLCASVEACLAYGLKRRTLGLFRTTSSTNALLQKIAKTCPEAGLVLDIHEKHMSQWDDANGSKSSIFDSKRSVRRPQKPPRSPLFYKNLWIRIALTERVLDKIVEYLVENADKFYGPDSLMADTLHASVVASLLIGPCALDYSKVKTQDHLWTDPSADELVQRHRIHGSAIQYQVSNGSMSSPKRMSLKIKRHPSLGSVDDLPRTAARNYVESLHQNHRDSLLYGKNNVSMQPKNVDHVIPGYLSLHRTCDVGLMVKWTPNQLMNNSANAGGDSFDRLLERSQYWEYAVSVPIQNVHYVHCHCQVDQSGSVVLVGKDGIQYPPFHFPPGPHLLAFISCLETGLQLCDARLDPPLADEHGVGKVFPPQRQSVSNFSSQPARSSNGTGGGDYVFQVVPNSPKRTDSISVPKGNDNVVGQRSWFNFNRQSISSKEDVAPRSPTESSVSLDSSLTASGLDMEIPETRDSVEQICESMRRQILARSFHGWLAHCRHLRTIRRHLTDLILPTACPVDWPTDASSGLTDAIWSRFLVPTRDAPSISPFEICRLVYYGGVEHKLRRKVWPYLLGHYQWDSTESDHEELDAMARLTYENNLTEWMALEAIIIQRDKEALVNCSQKGPSASDIPLVGDIHHHHVSNEVFEDHSLIGKSSEPSTKKWSASNGNAAAPSGSDSHKKNHLENGGSDFPSPASSVGGVYSDKLVDEFALNLHRIEKDVARCDRTYPYFTKVENLEKLRKVMGTYVWLNLSDGYFQGMCDLAAPLLVIFDDEVLTFSCFNQLMKRMCRNFPNYDGMDRNFANMRSLIQVLDSELFDLMRANGDYTHFYFCYRWFLLDFKRELVYDDVFLVWETIWAAAMVASEEFVLFVALAMLECYRDIILDNAMDFTDIIKFFNEMAEKHDGKTILNIARDLHKRIRDIISA